MICFSMQNWLRSLGIGVLLLVHGAPLAAQGDPQAGARRIADIAAIALDEYAIGVRNGRVVNEDELREARLFLDEARRVANRLPQDARDLAAPLLTRIATGVEALADEAGLRETLSELRTALESVLGVALDPLPANPPSLAHGARLYTQYCVQCHGAGGAGDGALASELDPPPSDLTDWPALRQTGPIDFFRVVNVGVAGTAMPSMLSQLDLEDRWAVALYASTLRHSRDAERLGAGWFETTCPECRIVVSDFGETALLNDDSLVTGIAAFGAPIDSAESRHIVAYARIAGAMEELGSNRMLAIARTVRRAKTEVAQAQELARSGESHQAAARALDAYLVFEQIEAAVRVRDSKLAGRVERAFTEFRASLLSDAGESEVSEARATVEVALDEALAKTTATASSGVLLSQSFVIIVREGLEAILIIAALMAFLHKTGASERKRDIGYGVLAAIGASGLTAIGFVTLFRTATRNQELLEGLTMLVAAGVLFAVSYWLVSKIEVRKWQEFVRTQMRKALASKRAFALGAVAFVAVYREGFETVLFYTALFATSDGSMSSAGSIVTGIVVGILLLVIVYYVMQRGSRRLPLKPFFAVTSALLYLMAFTFAGQGVAELQAAGAIPATPLSWMPALPLLGIFPTIQTLSIQLFLAAAVSVALLWVFWLEPKTSRARP